MLEHFCYLRTVSVTSDISNLFPYFREGRPSGKRCSNSAVIHYQRYCRAHSYACVHNWGDRIHNWRGGVNLCSTWTLARLYYWSTVLISRGLPRGVVVSSIVRWLAPPLHSGVWQTVALTIAVRHSV